MGQEVSGYSSALIHGVTRIENALDSCYELAMGGTAVGTGINSFDGFAESTASEISTITGLPFKTAENKFEALGGLNPKTRAMQRKILGNASVNDFEVTERMLLLIPKPLRDFAILKPKLQVVLVGMGSKFELWNIDNWKKTVSYTHLTLPTKA